MAGKNVERPAQSLLPEDGSPVAGGAASTDEVVTRPDGGVGRQMEELSRRAMALPDVRMDKVALVQSALANGSYRIQSSEIAARILESMKQDQESGGEDEPRGRRG